MMDAMRVMIYAALFFLLFHNLGTDDPLDCLVAGVGLLAYAWERPSRKHGQNLTFQMIERPPAPAPIRRR